MYVPNASRCFKSITNAILSEELYKFPGSLTAPHSLTTRITENSRGAIED
ncbi:hypothetical protein MMMDOFMJ_3841 [Methylobacterium gnaphalii]|nr:hypothetical protein MMMDOFMJ_3841 [Methylobacterium gnaphalii]